MPGPMAIVDDRDDGHSCKHALTSAHKSEGSREADPPYFRTARRSMKVCMKGAHLSCSAQHTHSVRKASELKYQDCRSRWGVQPEESFRQGV